MSNNEINKYKDTYSKLITEFTNLHNRHHEYIKRISRDGGTDVRRILRNLIKIERELIKCNAAVYLKMRNDTKEKLQKKRDDKSLKKKGK